MADPTDGVVNEGGVTGGGSSGDHRLTRFVLCRGVGLVYVVAFLAFQQQGPFLLDSRGLTPMRDFLAQVADHLGPDRLTRLPTLFWLDDGDLAIAAVGWIGLGLALATLAGVTNAGVMAVLWALHVSIVNAGQDWYGYGWETLLAETGFLAIFLCPWRTFSPRGLPPPHPAVIWLFRWLTFRILLGAGLIKVRGDPCWHDFTCLVWHYETQPNPHPLSIVFHWMPVWFHQAGVLYNHFVELACPWFLAFPRRFRIAAGACMAFFQVMLIASGNLAFLNWLTLVVGLSAFDDGLWRRILPGLEARLGAQPEVDLARWNARLRTGVATALCLFVAWRSLPVLDNLFLSERQSMNRSYDPLRLVNTYGAFGSVGSVREEAVIQGTSQDPMDKSAAWKDYEFPCKPGAIDRRPCLVTPYHLHLDWQMWFIPLQGIDQHRWVLHLLWKLLGGDARSLAQLATNPFPDAPPHAVRLARYEYHFVEPGEPGWWRREATGLYIRPITRDDPVLAEIMDQEGWRR